MFGTLVSCSEEAILNGAGVCGVMRGVHGCLK